MRLERGHRSARVQRSCWRGARGRARRLRERTRRRRQQQRERQLDDRRRAARAAASTSTRATAPPTRAPSRVSGDTIKIGTSLPQSGIYAAFSEILNGEKAYFEYLNADKGGVEIAGKKYKIELDRQGRRVRRGEDVRERAVARSTNDKVFALFNVVGTKNNLAIRDYLGEQCVPNLFAATGAPQWGNHDFPWMHRQRARAYPLEMQALVKYLKENKPNATIAMLRPNDDFGASYSETLKKLIKGTDMKIVRRRRYDTETGDVTAQMTASPRRKADVVRGRRDAARLPDRAQPASGASGWKPLVYMSGTCTSKTLMTHRRRERQRRAQRHAVDGPGRSRNGRTTRR